MAHHSGVNADGNAASVAELGLASVRSAIGILTAVYLRDMVGVAGVASEIRRALEETSDTEHLIIAIAATATSWLGAVASASDVNPLSKLQSMGWATAALAAATPTPSDSGPGNMPVD